VVRVQQTDVIRPIDFPPTPTILSHMSGRRAHWPIRRYALGDEPGDDLSAVTSPSERVAMMWRLAREGWALAGRTLPVYDRTSAPTRLFRPGERPEDE
jgi:hypothetical protein